MNRFAVVALLSSIALFGLSFFVLQRGGPKSKLHRIFFFLSASTAFWIFDTFMLWFLEDKQSAWLWRNINYPFVAYIPALFAHLILIVLKEEQKLRPLIRTSYVISTLFAVLSLTDLFIADIRPFPPYFNFVPVPGPLFHMFIAFFYGLVGYVHLRILFVWDKVSGQERTQLVYLLIAFLVGFAGTAIFFLLVYGINFEIYVPHDLVSLAFSLILAYAIVRHQLLDIEVVIKRTLQFAGLVGSVVAVVSLVAFVSQDLLARFVTIPKWASNILAAAIIAVLYEPLRNWLTEVTDKYLFQKKYDYKDLLKKFTDEVMVVLDLKRVGQMTVNTLTDSVKLDTCTLLLLNKDTRKYEVAAAKGLDNQKFIFDEQEQFITFLRETHEPIWLDSKIQYPPTLTGRAQELKARLCIPLHLHQDLIGILCLGKKKSDEEFTKEDMDILSNLVAKNLAVALTNAIQSDELDKTRAEAAQKEKLAVIGTLSAGINHEICNPLGIVKAQCEAFLLDAEDGILVGKSQQDVLERTSSIMRVALKQIDRATAITQKLSNFAKPIKEVSFQSVSVEQEIDEVLLLVGHDLKLEKIQVHKEIEPNLPPVLVDRRQFQEVLFNLVRNAGQAITPPGNIWIRVGVHGENVRIGIQDSGHGIPPDRLNKLFVPFFTTKEPGKGTGLGLFIVRQIVERNKGRISLESEVGKGTTFYLDFPITKPASAAAGVAK